MQSAGAGSTPKDNLASIFSQPSIAHSPTCVCESASMFGTHSVGRCEIQWSIAAADSNLQFSAKPPQPLTPPHSFLAPHRATVDTHSRERTRQEERHSPSSYVLYSWVMSYIRYGPELCKRSPKIHNTLSVTLTN